MTVLDQLGLIAGNGVYPKLVAQSARALGVRQIAAVAFTGETDPALADLVDQIEWLRVGQLDRMIKTLHHWNVRNALMAGQIAPRHLYQLRPDWRALLLLAKLKERNAESIFGAIANELKKAGIFLLPATTFLEKSLAPLGLITGPRLSRREKADVEVGWGIAKKIAALDIGQTIVVKNGTVAAVEALDGTDETLRRGGALSGGKGVLIKVAKPKQDMRFDVPVVGMETIRVAKDVGIRVLAVEAKQTLLLERDDLLAAVRSAGISLVGVGPGGKFKD